MAEDLLSTVQAAEIVGCSRDVIWRALKEGILAGQRVGRSYVIRRADLQAWLDAGHYKPEMARRYPPKKKKDTGGSR